MSEFAAKKVEELLELIPRFPNSDQRSRELVSNTISNTMSIVQGELSLGSYGLSLMNEKTQARANMITGVAALHIETLANGSHTRTLLYNPDYLAQTMIKLTSHKTRALALYYLRGSTAHELFHIHQDDVDPVGLIRERNSLGEAKSLAEFLDRYNRSWMERNAESYAKDYLKKREHWYVRLMAQFYNEADLLRGD